ncbi:hypothetical protein VTL71DRAFT_13737 [Oculimacula yallundae]|uniref:Uncharacterized protein n=1 Tax=Oculimacula yallundae TaxID=86028 RepID=A0ABR4CNC3_9HELO
MMGLWKWECLWMERSGMGFYCSRLVTHSNLAMGVIVRISKNFLEYQFIFVHFDKEASKRINTFDIITATNHFTIFTTSCCDLPRNDCPYKVNGM